MPTEFFQQYQIKTEAPPSATSASLITRFESAWHQPWSEPVRFKIVPRLQIVLAASGLFAPVLIETQITDRYESRWHQPWSEPVRVRLRLGAGANLFNSLPTPRVVIVGDYIFGWYQEWRNPVWPKKGMASRLQESLARPIQVIPPPDVILRMAATETNNDRVQSSIWVYNDLPPPADLTAVNVSIVEIPDQNEVGVSIKEDE